MLMTLPSAKPAALTYADSMTRDLNRAAQNALTRGVPYGFGLSEGSYAVYRFEDEVWTSVFEGKPAAPVTAAMKIEGAVTPLRPAGTPSVIFEPTGMNAPFSVTLSADDVRFEVITDGAGKTVMRAR